MTDKKKRKSQHSQAQALLGERVQLKRCLSGLHIAKAVAKVHLDVALAERLEASQLTAQHGQALELRQET